MIFLVRHGETEWNLLRRYQGWGDSPLTRRGVAQAEAFGRVLRALPETEGAEIVSSPLGRARCTAEIIKEALGGTGLITFDERLKEISIGSWDGHDHADIERLSPGIFDGGGRYEWYFHTPNGETYADFDSRVSAWLATCGTHTQIVVAHGIVTRVLRGLCRAAACHCAELAGAARPRLSPYRRSDRRDRSRHGLDQ
jgi:broad specificity phosphatase PhoE